MNFAYHAFAALIGVVVASGAAVSSAATVTFDEGAFNGAAYVEEAFQFSPAGLTNTLCPTSLCLLLNHGSLADVTMTAVSGAPFDLLGFSFHFVGDEKRQRGVLNVRGKIDQTFAQEILGNDPFTITFGNEFASVSNIVFSYSGPGSARLDSVTVRGVAAIPLPSTMPLFVGASGGLGFLAFRRRKSVAAQLTS